MTVFYNGTRSLRHAQVTACSYREMEGLLWQALESGRKAFVILSHNFELLNGSMNRPDDIVVTRFRKLCSFLDRHRDCFHVRGFYGLTPDLGVFAACSAYLADLENRAQNAGTRHKAVSLNQIWHFHQVPIKLQLGDKTLLAPELWLQVREVGLDDETPASGGADAAGGSSSSRIARLSDTIAAHRRRAARTEEAAMIISAMYLPSTSGIISICGSHLRSTRANFHPRRAQPSTVRSGNMRSIAAEIFRGRFTSRPGKCRNSFGLLAPFPKITYQEKLLDAGLPDSEEFLREMEQLARQGRVRGFILFHQG